ncbi:MAG: serine hydrolase [Nevskia sp.]|nr:serine hydrolase [Nevskia sp.]
MSLQAQADALLKRAADAGDVPGVVAMVTNREGTLYEGAFGRRSLADPAPMTTDTVGLIASMTKALTSTAALQLLEQGRVDLDSPASRWLPQLAEAEVLEGFDDAGQPRTRPPKRPVTLRHLLTHTSGFGYEFLSVPLQKYHEARRVPSIFGCALAALRQPLLFDPGERWQYGIGIDWVGQLVEAVSGQKLGAYLAQHVLGPVGMQETAFVPTPDMAPRLARIHQRGPDGKLVPLDFPLPQEPEFEMGGGGLFGTAGDYLKFVRMILNRGLAIGGRVLRPETVELMSSNQLGALEVLPAKSANPLLTNDMALPPGIPHRWGLAWMINEKPLPTGRPAGSLMWAGLTNSYYWIDPHTGIGGVVLMQILPFADVKAMPLFLNFEYTVYQNL